MISVPKVIDRFKKRSRGSS